MSRQFSSSKIHIQWVFLHLVHHCFLFFLGQFCYHCLDSSIYIFPSLLLLGLVIRTLVFLVSSFLAFKTSPFPHQFGSLICGHGVYVHGVQISFLFRRKLEPLLCLARWLSRFTFPSKDMLHFLPVRMEFGCFLIPILQGC